MSHKVYSVRDPSEGISTETCAERWSVAQLHSNTKTTVMKCIANNFLIEMCFEHFLKYNCIENARGRIVGSQLSMQMLQKKQVSLISVLVCILEI